MLSVIHASSAWAAMPPGGLRLGAAAAASGAAAAPHASVRRPYPCEYLARRQDRVIDRIAL